MRCRTCEYSLWNLRTRNCPECGEPFRPSEYEFVANSVQYQCPHCAQSYYGTDDHGHLTPIEFQCVKCGQSVHMDEMILLPTMGVEEAQTEVDFVPWLERKRRGFFRGWLKTVWRSMTSAERLMAAAPIAPAPFQAAAFLIINAFTTLLIGGSILWVAGGTELIIGFLIALLAVIVFGVVWTALTHAILHFTNWRTGGYSRTVEAICYGSGPMMISSVPCLGFYLWPVSMVWWIISATLATKAAHRLTGLRAALAVGLPPLLSTVLLMGGVMALTFGVMRSTMTTLGPTISATNVANGVIAYAVNGDGSGPLHPARLVLDGSLRASDFDRRTSNVPPATITVGNRRLIEYEYAANNYNTLNAELTSIEADLPDDLVALRVGDYLFTHYGVDLLGNDADLLWIVIAASDGAAPLDPIMVVAGSGRARPISRSQFGSDLALQNEARQQAGLPPLPHPDDIGDEPVRAAVIDGN